MSARNKKATIWKAVLEINDNSFKYYLVIFLTLSFLELFWRGGFVFRYLRFPLKWMAAFVLLSGILKLFFGRNRRCFSIIERAFPKLAFRIKRFVRAGKKICLVLGKKLFCGRRVFFLFIFSLIFYLILLLWQDFLNVAGFKKILAFSQKEAAWLFNPKTNRLNWFLAWVVVTGFWAFLFSSVRLLPLKKRPAQIQLSGLKFIYSLALIIGFGAAAGLVVFFKTHSLGLPAYFLAILFGLIFMFLLTMILYAKEKNA